MRGLRISPPPFSTSATPGVAALLPLLGVNENLREPRVSGAEGEESVASTPVALAPKPPDGAVSAVGEIPPKETLRGT